MYVSTQPLCSGKRNIDSTDKTNTPDCSSNDGNYSLTLPLPSDYFVVSIDNKCKRIYDSECTNYNYFMKFESNTWSTVIDGKTSYKAYKFEPTPYLAKTDSESHLRFVINISGEVNFINGDGTKDNPYIFE